METFVVRVFVPQGDPVASLSGIVEHVATGGSTTFQGEGELVRLIRAAIGAVEAAMEQGTEPKS